MKTFFITGTDTGVGKTFTSCALIEKLKQENLIVSALKPIAAGCELIDQEWKNEDALLLQRHANSQQSYKQINPIALKQAIAPHIAAERENVELSVDSLNQHCKHNLSADADYCLIEGAGGWMVPFNSSTTYADWVAHKEWPVILVVGLRLGCLNHALLTQQAIKHSKLKVAAWIANTIDPDMVEKEANIETLQHMITAPLLGVVPYFSNHDPISAAEYINTQFI